MTNNNRQHYINRLISIGGMAVLTIGQGCDPVDKRLTIVNNSDELIFYTFSSIDSIYTRSPFTNSYQIEESDTIWDESRNLLLPNNSKAISIIGRNAWEDHFNGMQDSSLKIFIFNKELITGVPWDTIVAKLLYTKMFTYTVNELEDLNWNVEYK